MHDFSRRRFLSNTMLGSAALAAGFPAPFAAAAPISSKVTINPISVLCTVYYLGQIEGIWAKHEWNVTEWVGSGGGGTAIRTIATGGIPIGEMSATAAFGAWLVGAPIRILTGTIIKPTELVYIAKPGSKISKPQDLIGKKLGYTGPGSGTHTAAMLALEQLGLTGKVELVSTGNIREGVALMERGEIDVASQLSALVKSTDKYEIIFRVPDFVPKYAYGAIVAAESFVQKSPEHVTSFLKARAEALDRVKKDPDAAADAWMKNSRGLERDSLRKTITSMTESQAWVSYGWDVAAVQASLRSMELVGQIPSAKGLPLAEMLDQSFIPPENRIKI